MKSADIAVLMEGIAPVLRDLVAKEMAPAVERLEMLEQRLGDVTTFAKTLDDLEKSIACRIAALPEPPTAEEVAALIPAPSSGKDGAPGANGKDADEHEIAQRVLRAVMGSLPKTKDGEPGKDGAPGKDGVGLAGALIDRDGNLVLTLTDGKAVSLGTVVGKDGAAGRDGRDGLGFTELDVADEDGTFVLTFTRDDQVKEFRIRKPTLADAYRGIWKDGPYKAGDLVTWAGSLFIARRDTLAKPESNDDWRLAVKRGRDGKDGELKAPRAPAKVTL